jgi:hypothetical protein
MEGKTVTFSRFEELVSAKWSTEEYTYGSRGIAARAVMHDLESEGVTNTDELFDRLKAKYKEMLFYTGD